MEIEMAKCYLAVSDISEERARAVLKEWGGSPELELVRSSKAFPVVFNILPGRTEFLFLYDAPAGWSVDEEVKFQGLPAIPVEV
jgi:hypothetical protein